MVSLGFFQIWVANGKTSLLSSVQDLVIWMSQSPTSFPSTQGVFQLNIQVQIYLLMNELNGALKVGMIEYPTASQVGPGLKRPAQWDCLSGRAGTVIWAQVVLLRGWPLFCCFLRWQGNLFERYYVYQDHQDFFSDTYSRRVVLCNLM